MRGECDTWSSKGLIPKETPDVASSAGLIYMTSAIHEIPWWATFEVIQGLMLYSSMVQSLTTSIAQVKAHQNSSGRRESATTAARSCSDWPVASAEGSEEQRTAMGS